MHYYKHHIGDHRSQTMHLSNEEDLAYRRLKDWYLDTEKPIPLETQWVSRRLRVTCEALESVLQDFFQCTENGWVNAGLEKIIADYQAQNAKNAANGRKGGRPKAQKEPEKNPVGFQSEPSGKANHKPLTNNQEPITNTHTPPPPSCERTPAREAQRVFGEKTFPALGELDEAPKPQTPEKPMLPSMTGAICVALKSQGIFDVNPSHPTLRALVDAGVGVDVFVQAAQAAAGKAKGFAYVLGIVKGQMAEAVKLAEAASAQAALAIKSASNTRQHGHQPQRMTFQERDRELARDRYEEIFGKPHPERVAKQERTIIDITPSASFLGVEK